MPQRNSLAGILGGKVFRGLNLTQLTLVMHVIRIDSGGRQIYISKVMPDSGIVTGQDYHVASGLRHLWVTGGGQFHFTVTPDCTIDYDAALDNKVFTEKGQTQLGVVGA